MLAGLPARSPARKRIAIATSTADPMKAVLPARGAHDRQIEEAPRNLGENVGSARDRYVEHARPAETVARRAASSNLAMAAFAGFSFSTR